MNQHDLHNNVLQKVCVESKNLAVASQIGGAIDRQGFGGVEFIANYGTIAATGTTVALTIMESDLPTAASFTSVADADLLGTEASASIVAATPRTAGSNSAVCLRIGYKGNKRYVKGKLKASASSTGGLVAVLFNPEIRPTSAL